MLEGTGRIKAFKQMIDTGHQRANSLFYILTIDPSLHTTMR